MFRTLPDEPYKLNSNFDFYYPEEEPIFNIAGGFRTSTREPWQYSILDKKQGKRFTKPKKEMVLMDQTEVRRERIWQMLTESLLNFPGSPGMYCHEKLI